MPLSCSCVWATSFVWSIRRLLSASTVYRQRLAASVPNRRATFRSETIGARHRFHTTRTSRVYSRSLGLVRRCATSCCHTNNRSRICRTVLRFFEQGDQRSSTMHFPCEFLQIVSNHHVLWYPRIAFDNQR